MADLAFGRSIALTCGEKSKIMRSIALTFLSATLLLGTGTPQTGSQATGSIRGEVVTKANNGEASLVPNVHIVLRGPADREAQSDAQGAFAIDGLPPGVYGVEASAPGLSATVVLEVKAGPASVVAIELNVASVTSGVTVSASAAPVDESAQKNTIGESTVEKAPNQDEKIETLLPLVPGVVRGPDGRINMKGAQATQAGWLVNSANVTDPATGGQAINLPIDVVSSVQVISNPYDPE